MVVKEGEFTKKQGAFYKNLSKTGFDLSKRADCAKKAKYAYPDQAAYKILRSSRPNEIIQKEMVDQGYTPKKLVKELKRLTFKSMNPFRSNMPDNKERRESTKMGFQLFDAFPAKKVDIHKTETHFDISVETVKKLHEQLGRETVIDVEPIEEEEEEVEPF